MEGVGFTAHWNTTSMPLVMPPLMPPLRLVSVTTRPFSMRRLSLKAEPYPQTAEKPPPNSMPFTPPMENTAWLSRLSTLSNHGSPTPAGRPHTAVWVMPPTLSWRSLAARMAALLAWAASSVRAGKSAPCRAATSAAARSAKGRSHASPQRRMCVPTVTPTPARADSRMAPAATSGAVTRPEKCPPPRQSS